MVELEKRRKRVLYRAAHRGFKEADLLIGAFAAAFIAHFGEGELSAFEQLLDEADHDIYAWALGSVPPPERIDAELLSRLMDFARGGGAARQVDIAGGPS